MKGPGGPGPRGMGTPEQPGKLLGRLARYILKSYSIHIVIVVICIFVSVLANVQGTMFMKTLIDQYITPLLSADTPDFGPLAAAIARVACFYVIEQGGSNVSGGQKQRLCIARALLKKPKILILDDSTSAVDTATDARIRRAFAEEIPDTTKLIIAQRVSSIQNADRIIVMDNGEINGFGTHEELLKTNAIYQEVFHSQTGGAGDFDEGGEPA